MLRHMADEERPPKRPATYQDVIDAPEHMVAEIPDGELFLSPRPAPRHAFSTTILTGILIPNFGDNRATSGPGGWLILIEPELHIGPDVVVPDLAGWKRERMPRLPKEAFFPKAPDWVCEVLSPSTEKIDRTRKLRIYARERVEYLWLINPVLRTLEVRRRHGDGWFEAVVYRDEAIVRAEPFEAIEIDLSRLWGEVETSANGEAQE
jgi:Uma2 family endonuclease